MKKLTFTYQKLKINIMRGQTLLILILVMTVALAIGLSIVQRSLTDISTATNVEQSAKAFSAAEAGIEKAIQSNSSITTPTAIGDATLQRVDKTDAPAANQALEYYPLPQEEIAQVWLANPSDLSSPYGASTLNIFWGNSGTQTSSSGAPAIEITVVYQDTSGNYRSGKYFYDPNSSRASANGFTSTITACPSPAITTSLSSVAKQFMCKQTIDVSSAKLTSLSKLILLRARLLYNTDTSHSFAVEPVSPASLPVQGKVFTSTGLAGQTQRKVQVFMEDKVVPSWFDFAILSAGEISK